MPEANSSEQAAAPESTAVPESAPVEQEQPEAQPVASDTTETVAETDEAKNARVAEEQRKSAEKRRNSFERRAAELTAEKYAERDRAERLERMVEHLIRAKGGGEQAAEDVEPKREQFTDYEDFVAAKTEYKVAKRAEALINERLSGVQQAQAHTATQYEAAQLRQQFLTRQQEFAKSTPDYAEVVNTDDVRIPNEAAALLHTMEDAPAVIYHMAKNPEVAAKLWNEPPIRQAIFLGALSASLKGTPQVSKAPAPGKPVGARSGESGEPPSDYEGYKKWKAARRRASNA